MKPSTKTDINTPRKPQDLHQRIDDQEITIEEYFVIWKGEQAAIAIRQKYGDYVHQPEGEHGDEVLAGSTMLAHTKKNKTFRIEFNSKAAQTIDSTLKIYSYEDVLQIQRNIYAILKLKDDLTPTDPQRENMSNAVKLIKKIKETHENQLGKSQTRNKK